MTTKWKHMDKYRYKIIKCAFFTLFGIFYTKVEDEDIEIKRVPSVGVNIWDMQE